MNEKEPDVVYVYDKWENQMTHRASSELTVFKTLIEKAEGLIVTMINDPVLTIIGRRLSFRKI